MGSLDHLARAYAGARAVRVAKGDAGRGIKPGTPEMAIVVDQWTSAAEAEDEAEDALLEAAWEQYGKER